MNTQKYKIPRIAKAPSRKLIKTASDPFTEGISKPWVSFEHYLAEAKYSGKLSKAQKEARIAAIKAREEKEDSAWR